MTNCYSALFFTLNMQIFSTALYSGIRRKDQEKREKIFRNICKVKNNPYLCTAFEKQGSSHEEFWRGGRVVDCGGLENRCTARYPGFESLSLRKEIVILVKSRFYENFFCSSLKGKNRKVCADLFFRREMVNFKNA